MSDLPLTEKDVTPAASIDARNIESPLPLLRLKRELAIMSKEEVIRIDCTDAGASNDIASWCSRLGHTFLGERQESSFFSLFVRK